MNFSEFLITEQYYGIIESPWGPETTKVYKNSNNQETKAILNNSKSKSLRVLLDLSSNNVYLWDSHTATHEDMVNNFKHELSSNIVRAYIDDINSVFAGNPQWKGTVFDNLKLVGLANRLDHPRIANIIGKTVHEL